MFYDFMGPNATETIAKKEFEDGVHHWVIVHELGHWFQACRGITEKTSKPYAIEFGADRIAASYWNEHDPGVIAHQRPVFEVILQNFPNPVPRKRAWSRPSMTTIRSLGRRRGIFVLYTKDESTSHGERCCLGHIAF